MRFYLYRCLPNKQILRNDFATADEAIAFMNTERFPYVTDETGKVYKTKEEIINAESIGSKYPIGLDFEIPRRRTVPKDSDRELSGTDSDRTESSSERDNKRDKQS